MYAPIHQLLIPFSVLGAGEVVAEVDPVVFCAQRAAAFAPGAHAGTLYAPGTDQANVYTPGSKAGKVC